MSTLSVGTIKNSGSGYMVFRDSSNTEVGKLGGAWVQFNGESTPSRFYLGNQAPESGASFTTVKAHNFDGTEYMTTSDPFTNGSLTNREIVMWFQNNTTGGTATYILNNIKIHDGRLLPNF